jgi:hypothetical protein
MSSYMEEQVNRTGRWIRKYTRRKEEEWPEKNRLGLEIMNLLVERETSLGDALDVLTRVMLGAVVAQCGNSQGRTYREIEDELQVSQTTIAKIKKEMTTDDHSS